MVGAAGRKDNDCCGHSLVDRFSRILGSTNQTGRLPYWKTSHGRALGSLPTFYGRREQFPVGPGVPPSVRIPVAIILRYPAHLVGVPSGGCLSHTWHHHLGRNNPKGEHRRVRVLPNHPMASLFCNIDQILGVGCTESALEQHNESLTGHTI